ncbi:sodium:calcium antiporter [Fervidibacillus halotolerans]|uniref:Sodium:calcium antiporter n=1 Tax=Fervidibacillus halotolerans TaxID=2980027 RepID=A0A9E8LXU6_9BACI|nr:sodium:calcium antiporter [Fervidibacillus halotolerans]WAA11743.1 sodium:calcium antiporter [Fervidibacillus halotolerans]
MVYVTFTVTAILIVILAIFLSVLADLIDGKSTLKDFVISFLLGSAAALPELTTSFTSLIISNPDLAMGNIFGSNLYNIMILAFADIIFRKRRVFFYAHKENAYNTGLIIVLSGVVALSMSMDFSYEIFGFGLDMMVVAIVYFIGMKMVSKYSVADIGERDRYMFDVESVTYQVAVGNESDEKQWTSQIIEKESVETFDRRLKKRLDRYSLKFIWVLFFITASFVLIDGSLLTVAADGIAVETGLGSTFVGSFFLAASTSLPETVSVITSIRLRNYNLAIGAILGSCLFNFINLIITDALYREPLIHSVNDSHLYTVLASMVLLVIAMYSMLRKKVANRWTYLIPSFLIVLFYFISSYILFVNSVG